ncbi:MAG TPA: helix-turn-helix transcriptional regulator [Cellulomonadaceae bacterium]|nr:helix-turn-helix transcriptional regulator [Cellulomonadaceae bacterium]
MKVESPRTRRDLANLGAHLAASRKIQGLTQQELAERAGITRGTLVRLESGDGGPRLDALLAVARVLGFSGALVEAADPLNTEFGRMHAGRADRKRVR